VCLLYNKNIPYIKYLILKNYSKHNFYIQNKKSIKNNDNNSRGKIIGLTTTVYSRVTTLTTITKTPIVTSERLILVPTMTKK